MDFNRTVMKTTRFCILASAEMDGPTISANADGFNLMAPISWEACAPGGVIAFEIACQLQDQGEPVALVALIDAADVAASLKPWRFVGHDSAAFLRDSPKSNDNDLLLPGEPMGWIAHKALRKTRNLTVYMGSEPCSDPA